MSDERRSLILTKAVEVFAAYGFRRASMADIAAAAGLSRPALYQYFANKTEIFRAGAAKAHEDALSAAQSATREAAPLSAQLGEMLVAYKGVAFAILADTPHGRELIDMHDALAEDISRDATEQAAAYFATVLTPHAAAGRDVGRLARLLIAAAWAAAERAESREMFEADMRALQVAKSRLDLSGVFSGDVSGVTWNGNHRKPIIARIPIMTLTISKVARMVQRVKKFRQVLLGGNIFSGHKDHVSHPLVATLQIGIVARLSSLK